MIKKITIAITALAALLLPVACAAPKTSCANGVCVATDPEGMDHVWPEPAPETAGPAKKVDPKVKGLPTALPPGVVPNPKPSRRDHRVEFFIRRVGTEKIEVEYSVPPARRPGPFIVDTRDWREVEWARGPGMAHLWVTRVYVRGQTEVDRGLIECWITVDGKIPDNANRPDGVPSFKAEGQSTGRFDCYVSAWIPEPAK